MKEKAFFIIFKGLSVVRSCLRPKCGSLNLGTKEKQMFQIAKWFMNK